MIEQQLFSEEDAPTKFGIGHVELVASVPVSPDPQNERVESLAACKRNLPWCVL